MRPSFSSIRDRLRFVGRERPDYDLRSFPDFLIIGPQRTGSTWLHENLIMHPQVFMPQRKELYYFSVLQYPEAHPAHLAAAQRDLDWYLDHFRLSVEQFAELDTWSRRRFDVPYAPRVSGEGTASYAATLSPEMIEEIVTLNPSIRVLTFVRDPIERTWSHAKKDLLRETGRELEEVPEAEWFDFFGSWYAHRCGHSEEYLPAWRAAVPADQLLVAKFRDIARRPVELLAEIARFLGIDDDPRFMLKPGQPVNTTEVLEIPANLRARLEELFGVEVLRLRELDMI
ncbi:MAG: sulfotransferase [Planctomycetota bacterium]